MRHLIFKSNDVILRQATRGELSSDDMVRRLAPLSDDSSAKRIEASLAANPGMSKATLVRLLASPYKRTLLTCVALLSAFLLCNYWIPRLSGELIARLSGEQGGPAAAGGVLAWLVGVSLSSWFFLNHGFDQAFLLGLKVRSLCARLIARAERNESEVSPALAYLSHDLTRIQLGFECGPLLALTSTSVLISCVLLVRFLGFFGLLGAGVVLALVLIAQKLSRRVGALAKNVAEANAGRVRHADFIVSHLETITVRGWKAKMRQLLDASREAEVAALWRSGKWVVVLNVVFAVTPVLMTVASLLPSLVFSGSIAAKDVFPALIVLAILRSSFTNLPMTVRFIAEGLDSLSRLPRVLTRPVDLKTEGPRAPDLCRELAGKHVVVVGSPGSGRSTVLRAVATELKQTSPVAYVAQSPWVHRGSVTENIIGTNMLDALRVKQMLAAVALDRDLRQMGQDEGMAVEPQGRNLSGGQRQRLAIARALYSDVAFLVMDEPLSALDPLVRRHVAASLKTELQGKTLVFSSTEAREILASDWVLEVERGVVVRQGTPTELSRNETSLVHAYVKGGVKESDGEHSPTLLAKDDDATTTQKTGECPLKTEQPATLTMGGFASYLKLWGTPAFLATVALMLGLKELLAIGSDVLISNTTGEVLDAAALSHFVSVYGAMVFGAISAAALAMALLVRGGLKAASSLHDLVVTHLFATPVRILRLTPSSDHLARLVHDQSVVDQSAGQKMANFLLALAGVVGTLALVVGSMPQMLILLIPIGACYFGYSKRFRAATKSISRASSDAAGVMIEDFKEYGAGTDCLALSGQRDAWRAKRVASALHRYESSAYFSQYLERWFSLRLELIGALIFSVVAFALYRAGLAGQAFGAAAGLAMTYSSALTAALGRVVKMMAYMDHDLVSVTNMKEYGASNAVNGGPMIASPGRGDLVFDHVTFAYPKDLQPVFTKISFAVAHAEKLAVVGRTGSGKSTLISLLLRLQEPSVGQIRVGGLALADIPEDQVARFVYVAPQQPIFLPGRLRDAFVDQDLSDDDVWQALATLGLRDAVAALPGGLNFVVDQGKELPLALSQQQLLFVAGSLLTQAPIVILDEPTAALGTAEAKTVLDSVVRTLRDKTLLVITHQHQLVGCFDGTLQLGEGKATVARATKVESHSQTRP